VIFYRVKPCDHAHDSSSGFEPEFGEWSAVGSEPERPQIHSAVDDADFACRITANLSHEFSLRVRNAQVRGGGWYQHAISKPLNRVPPIDGIVNPGDAMRDIVQHGSQATNQRGSRSMHDDDVGLHISDMHEYTIERPGGASFAASVKRFSGNAVFLDSVE
jgi:hypothetical protein